jgi:hypothetical protein
LPKNDKPDSLTPREFVGPNVQEVGDSFQFRPRLSERLPHSLGELQFIEPRVEVAQIVWLVITHDIPL